MRGGGGIRTHSFLSRITSDDFSFGRRSKLALVHLETHKVTWS